MAILFPSHEYSRDFAYSHGRLDRLSEQRGDEAMNARLRAHPGATIVLFSADRVVLPASNPDDPRLSPQHLATLQTDLADAILLGTDRDTGAPVYATTTPLTPEAIDPIDGYVLNDVRSLASAGTMPLDLLGSVAQGAATLNWHRTHGFCSKCGARSVMAQAGWRRDCTACGTQHFPRTDPVVIMLAIDGDRCLMGRSGRFLPNMYSCLAGFVEPGETLEDATRREILEESGVRTGRVSYFASQPWPFPMSLMIGMFAEATTTEIHFDTVELEDCRWFTRDECRHILAGTHPDGIVAPRPMAIAHHLLKAFVEG